MIYFLSVCWINYVDITFCEFCFYDDFVRFDFLFVLEIYYVFF